MLRTENLTYSYDEQQSIAFPDIRCKAGEHWLLLGQSGTGKTTLLHLLAGLRRPQSGTLEVAGQNMYALKGAALDRFRGQHIGIVFQQSHFVRSLSVAENLQAGQFFAKQPQDKSRIRSLLEQLNLGHKLQAKPQELSIGEQQRMAIARALVNKPSIILADEPTSALDDDNCAEVIRLLEEQAQQQNAALLIVTHDQRLKDYFQHQINL